MSPSHAKKHFCHVTNDDVSGVFCPVATFEACIIDLQPSCHYQIVSLSSQYHSIFLLKVAISFSCSSLRLFINIIDCIDDIYI